MRGKRRDCAQFFNGDGRLMSRTPARVTQADVARSIRAAMQAGAGGVEVRPDGTIFIHLSKDAEEQQKLVAAKDRPVL
jgi:hypothetical protein